MQVQFLSSLSPLVSYYDAFILDLWGVIHDGQQLYPGVLERLEDLRAAGKKIIFLSNAPRRASVVQEALSRMGIGETLYDRVITSGETAYQCLADLRHPERSVGSLSIETLRFTQHDDAFHEYFYIGLEKDRRLLEGLDYVEVMEPESAQFLLLAHSYTDNQPLVELEPLLTRCLAQKMPALCINPDLEVVRMNGEQVYCAGLLAQEYHERGGEVLYFGKPHPVVYEQCFKMLADTNQDRILAVGDNLATDIKGACAVGIANVLVTGGVLKNAVGEAGGPDYEENCRDIITQENIFPNFILRSFGA